MRDFEVSDQNGTSTLEIRRVVDRFQTTTAIIMSEKQVTAEGGADSNPNHALSSEHSTSSWPPPRRDDSRSPWYWSVLFHKNLNDGDQRVTAKWGTEYGSISAPPTETGRPKRWSLIQGMAHAPPTKTGRPTRWSRIKESVFSPDFILSHSTMDGENRENSVNWSDLAKDSYELRLYECFLIFVALLSVGVLAYSFLFENWTIIDSLYFTIVMLSTTGYGDITPSTPGGKLFASLFALAGIALLGLTLGVFGNRLVEAEIAYSQEIKSKSSSALERAFGKRSSRKRSETEKIKYDAELVLQHAESTSSSLTDTDSECSSVRDEETHGIKGIICGDRCDDGEHDNQPCDDNDTATTSTTTKKSTTTLSMAVTTTTTMAVTSTTAAAAAATTMTARQ